MITNLEEYILNPLYSGLILYTIVILLVLFSFQSFEMKCSEHIKFFIYSYTICTILSICYKKILEKQFRQKHNLDKTNLKIVEDVHNISSVQKNSSNNNNTKSIDVLIPTQ